MVELFDFPDYCSSRQPLVNRCKTNAGGCHDTFCQPVWGRDGGSGEHYASNSEVLVDSTAIAYLLARQRRERSSAARSQRAQAA
jgi:hypothetical protein